MKENHIWTLIAKHHDGTLENQEEEELLKWVNKSPENKKAFKDAIRILMASKPELQVETKPAWEKLKANLDEDRTVSFPTAKTPFLPQWFQVAAIFLILIVIGGVAYFTQLRDDSTMQDLTTHYITHPGDVDTFQIQLPDGSKVWLNKKSQLTYLHDFGENDRVVQLIGEGFFEVSKDPDRPFTVISQEIRTTALGTSFNVRAFEDQDEVMVALATGKVNVSIETEASGAVDSVPLVPGEEITITRTSKQYKKGTFDPLERLAWKDGMIFFKGANVQKIADVLGRWYDVQFEIKDSSRIESLITATFKNESLENVLEMLSYSADYQFEVETDVIKISPK